MEVAILGFVQKKKFGGVNEFSVSNGRISFSAMELGCALTKILVPGKNGAKIDIVLGYDDFDGYRNGNSCHGAVVGRVANRIKGASFSIDGKTCRLDKNDGENCLHSGFSRFEKMTWRGEPFSDGENAGVAFSRTGASGEQGFFGNVEFKVVYTLTKRDELILEYFARTDFPTPVNLTNHSYFNLDGKSSKSSVLSHILQLDCDYYLETSDDLVPTGKIADVSNSAFDFRTEKTVGADIERTMAHSRGYDTCFVTKADETECRKIGFLKSDLSGIKMEISTNQYGIQLYTGNYLCGTGKRGEKLEMHGGICFETQRFPNAVNIPQFPCSVLRPEEKYYSKTVFAF